MPAAIVPLLVGHFYPLHLSFSLFFFVIYEVLKQIAISHLLAWQPQQGESDLSSFNFLFIFLTQN